MDEEVKKPMKTLANCNLKDFLQQVNRIRKDVAELFKVAKVDEIRKHLPEYKGDETPEEKQEMLRAQSQKNLSDIVDACIGENIDLTIKVIGMMCFKTPAEAEEMTSDEFLDAVFNLLNSPRVIDFFTKLGNLAQTDTEKSSPTLT